MNSNRVNIYVLGEKLIEVLKSIEPLNGIVCKIFPVSSYGKEKPAAVEVFILKRLPAVKIDTAKYILCAKNPESLTVKELNMLYDLWPEPLTPSLVKFCFIKLQERIKSELEYTSETREHRKRILEMARQDYLTGLATRWYLQEYIENNEDEENITCIYFDLDNFKKVNDTYGHQAGDRALAATAEMMQREFTDGFAARMGGDEFMVVLTGKRSADEVEEKVNAFMSGLIEYYESMPTMKMLSVSAGISQKLHGEEKSIDRLIHESDRALYEAKKSGKACCKVYKSSMG